ncbi:hypothetical protein [Phreatobacter sp.]|uniref:hypothetical protein n=1 Tax=Phreatobacter sp. TaxID=1966341 RepID=UPI0022C1A627|nr:hypothetical protein [Phreatobacter sp.]MCZ8314351.1 hypothetical protein [Phreatobacter sp.]
MKPLVTVAYGGLSGIGRLPRWTTPFLVRLADRFLIAAANEGPPLRLVTRADGGLALVDPATDAFAREYGATGRPATPRLGPAADRIRGGLA